MNETQKWFCDICVIKQITLKVNQSIIFVILIYTKQNMVLLLKKMNLLDEELIK